MAKAISPIMRSPTEPGFFTARVYCCDEAIHIVVNSYNKGQGGSGFGFGGSWNNGSVTMFGTDFEALMAGYEYNDLHNSWANTSLFGGVVVDANLSGSVSGEYKGVSGTFKNVGFTDGSVGIHEKFIPFARQAVNQNIIIGGIDYSFAGPSEVTRKIQNSVGGTIYNYNLYADVDKDFVSRIVRDIKVSYSSRARLQIYGYSKGGDIAMQLTRALKVEGILVSLLMTVDAADGPISDDLDRSIPSNVQVNFNFFQTTPSGIGSHGGYNTGPGLIYNFDFTGSLNHSNIDDASVDIAIFLLEH